MTNQMHPLAELDRMLRIAIDALTFDTSAIDHLYDDPHADPAAYLLPLDLFRAINDFDANASDDDFYARDDLMINDAIIRALILREMIDARDALTRAIDSY